jgi:hypothetical protein
MAPAPLNNEWHSALLLMPTQPERHEQNALGGELLDGEHLRQIVFRCRDNLNQAARSRNA